MSKVQFAKEVASAFPGFLLDEDVSGADLVDWMSEHLEMLKRVKGGKLHRKLCEAFRGFVEYGHAVNGGDLVDWVNEHFGLKFEKLEPEARLFEGEWGHLFGPGSAETRCRIVIDAANDKLVAAQAFDGLKWVAMSKAELDDLAESVLEVNSRHRFQAAN
jgi:hypothetical protein